MLGEKLGLNKIEHIRYYNEFYIPADFTIFKIDTLVISGSKVYIILRIEDDLRSTKFNRNKDKVQPSTYATLAGAELKLRCPGIGVKPRVIRDSDVEEGSIWILEEVTKDLLKEGADSWKVNSEITIKELDPLLKNHGMYKKLWEELDAGL